MQNIIEKYETCQPSPVLTFFQVNYFVDVQSGSILERKKIGGTKLFIIMYVLAGWGLPSETQMDNKEYIISL